MRRRIGPSPTRALILLAALAAAWWYLRAQVRREAAIETARRTSEAPTVAVAFATAPRDLAADEAAGGHTLARHVGLSDADLARRLAREPNLAAASTFTDRAAAERAVGAALDAGRARLRDWAARPPGANLALAWSGDGSPVGRVLERGAAAPATAAGARVVVRRRGDDWYVLTAYPEIPERAP